MTDLVGVTRWTQQEDSAPSAHECLKPLEAHPLLIDEGNKRYRFGHICKGSASVLDQGASWVQWSSSTWVPRRFSMGRPSACSHFVASQQMANQSMPDNTATIFQVHYLVASVPMAIVSLVGSIPVTGYLKTVLRLLWHA